MSATDPEPRAAVSALLDYPRFEYDYAVDDLLEPGEITIYQPTALDVTTHWLSIDAGSAVDLADIA